jgi:general secretion pathway protein B
MSYILDALRKADAQRARDPVRGIHAQPLRGATSVQPGSGLRPWYWVAGAAAVASVAWAGWFMFHDRSEVRVVASQSAGVQAPVVSQTPAMQAPARSLAPAPVVGTAIQPPPVVAPPPTAAQVAAAPPPGWPPTGGDPRNTSRPTMRGRPPLQQPGVAVEAPVVAPTAPTTAPAAARPSFNVSGTEIMSPATPTAPGSPVAALPPVSAAPRAPAAVMVATPPVTGLPPDAPKLAINGGVYSTSKSQRMLIVNGQVFNEGGEVAPGVMLEEIKAKTAVLSFRGARYTVSY